jgi:hypothetical protein
MSRNAAHRKQKPTPKVIKAPNEKRVNKKASRRSIANYRRCSRRSFLKSRLRCCIASSLRSEKLQNEPRFTDLKNEEASVSILFPAVFGRRISDRSEEFFHPQPDQTKCFCSRVLPGVEEGQNQHQRDFFEPRQPVVIDRDPVLEAA